MRYPSLFLIFWSSLSGFTLSAAPITSIHFFGDSLSDAGNIGTLTAGIYPSSPYYQGRFSNGPVWTEYFSALKGKPADGQPAGMTLGPNWFNIEIEGPGNNYAIGGARTGTSGALDSLNIPTGVLTQTQYYLSEVNQAADAAALYVLFGGGNDLRDAAQLSGAMREQAANNAAFNIAVSTYLLSQAGARRFLILNAPDIGLTPEARLVRNNANSATLATLQYNGALNYFLNSIATPELAIQVFDTFTLFHALYQDALNGGTLSGITNATTPCFAGFAGSQGANCDVSLFADDIHPTARVHAILGYTVNSSVQNPEPATILTVSLVFGLIAWRKRRPRPTE